MVGVKRTFICFYLCRVGRGGGYKGLGIMELTSLASLWGFYCIFPFRNQILFPEEVGFQRWIQLHRRSDLHKVFIKNYAQVRMQDFLK